MSSHARHHCGDHCLTSDDGSSTCGKHVSKHAPRALREFCAKPELSMTAKLLHRSPAPVCFHQQRSHGPLRQRVATRSQQTHSSLHDNVLNERSSKADVLRSSQPWVRRSKQLQRSSTQPYAVASADGGGDGGGAAIPDGKLTSDDREPEGSSPEELNAVLAKVHLFGH